MKPLNSKFSRIFGISIGKSCRGICEILISYDHITSFERKDHFFKQNLDLWAHKTCAHDDVTKWKHFRVTGPLWGESTGDRWIPSQRPVTGSFDVFFDMCLNKRSNKQSRRRWIETPSCALWRHCNDTKIWMNKVEAGNRSKYHEVNNKLPKISWCTVLIQYINKVISIQWKIWQFPCFSAFQQR